MSSNAEPAPQLVPRAGPSPQIRPSIAGLSKAQKNARKAEGPRTRLTDRLLADYTTALRTGINLNQAAAIAGVGAGTIQDWLRRGARAERKHWSERDQLDRACMHFLQEVLKAKGQYDMQAALIIGQSAGMTKERPKARKTRQKIVGGTVGANGDVTGGQVAEVTIEETEQLPDWRAAAYLLEQRRSYEYGQEIGLNDEQTAADVVTPEQMLQRLQQIRRARAEREAEDAEAEQGIVDAEVVEDEQLSDGFETVDHRIEPNENGL